MIWKLSLERDAFLIQMIYFCSLHLIGCISRCSANARQKLNRCTIRTHEGYNCTVTVDPWTQYLFQCTNVNVISFFFLTPLPLKKYCHHTACGISNTFVSTVHSFDTSATIVMLKHFFLYIWHNDTDYPYMHIYKYIFTLQIVTCLLILLK